VRAFRDFARQHLVEIVEDLSQFCALPSTAGRPEALRAAAEWAAQSLESCGLNAHLLSAGGSPVVVAERLARGKPTLLFYDHYDVQSPGNEGNWRFPPFSPRMYRRRLYARGAVDNKGDLVARLWALRAWKELYGRLPVGVRFLVEGEEEAGSPHLAAFVQEHPELLRADGCLWEYGETDRQGRPYLYLGMKGILSVELETRGAATELHSSWASIAPNPAWRLLWALGRLKSADEEVLIEGFYDHVDGPSHDEIRQSRRLPFPEEESRHAWNIPAFLADLSDGPLLLSQFYTPTCNISGIEGGHIGEGIRTIIPSSARARLDFRLVPKQQPEQILQLLRRYLDQEGFGDVTVRPLGLALPPFRTPPGHPFVQVVVEATRTVYRRRPAVFPTMGGSGPMYLFGEGLKMPIVAIGVGYPGSNVHGADENVRLVDLERGVAHVAAILGRVAEGLPK
jgi:acetylornithine deacetylase/succinyl-diaminopimelate desuccinylase-like protein